MKVYSPLLLSCLAIALPGAQSQLRGRKKHSVDQRQVHSFGRSGTKMRHLTYYEPDFDSVEDGTEYLEGKGGAAAATDGGYEGGKSSKGSHSYGGPASGGIAAGSTSGKGADGVAAGSTSGSRPGGVAAGSASGSRPGGVAAGSTSGKGANPALGGSIPSATEDGCNGYGEGKGGCSGGGAAPTGPVPAEPVPRPPTPAPTSDPTESPTSAPIASGSGVPPTAVPTCDEHTPTEVVVPAEPETTTERPTPSPTESPTAEPTENPTRAPVPDPTPEPTESPTDAPTTEPTESPTDAPTFEPTESPTDAPTPEPTESPTDGPTPEPTESPTEAPILVPANPPIESGSGVPPPVHTDCPTPEPVDEPASPPVAGSSSEPMCGDGNVDEDQGEECDWMATATNLNPNDRCKNHEFCNSYCECQKYCGNGEIEDWDGEQCDHSVDEDRFPNHGCEANYECDSKCMCKAVPTPSPTFSVQDTVPEPACGNGFVDEDEECDYEASNPHDECKKHEFCNSNCQCEDYCGNGEVDEIEDDDDEECDQTVDINLVPNHGCEPNYECDSKCKCKAIEVTTPEPTSICGNGEKEEGEYCDASAEPSGCEDGYYCVEGCSDCLPYCGNTIIDEGEGEQCDFMLPENENGCSTGYYCTTSCTCLPIITPSPTSAPVTASVPEPFCGDGIKESTEQCEHMLPDGENGCSEGYYCTSTCTCLPSPTPAPVADSVPEPFCGDGIKDSTEQCDYRLPADENGCDKEHFCTFSCTCQAFPTSAPVAESVPEPFCGDGMMDSTEQCDASAPDNPGCDGGFYCSECVCQPYCGNFEMDDGEQCDSSAPDSPDCPSGNYCENCSCVPYCGNFIVDNGEQCDSSAPDGPDCPSGYYCLNCSCIPYCGNGIVDNGEQCDPMVDSISGETGCEGGMQCLPECICPPIEGGTGDVICINYTLDFDTDINGDRIDPGIYVDDAMWAGLLTMSASGGAGDKPLLFDTANPGTQENGDPDLGAPNSGCEGGGPGIGAGGLPGTPGENCEPLGNVLIIQERGADVPDDEAGGGSITIDFDYAIPQVYELGMMDIEPQHPQTTLYVTHNEDDGTETTTSFPIEGTGNNGVQSIPIFLDNVTRLRVEFGTSGAIDWVTFCF